MPNGAHLPNALLEAATDPALLRDRSATKIYLYLAFQLDVCEPRAFSQRETAKAIGCKPHTFSRAVKLLVRLGYLDRRFVNGHSARYRLMFNRIKPSAPNVTANGSRQRSKR